MNGADDRFHAQIGRRSTKPRPVVTADSPTITPGASQMAKAGARQEGTNAESSYVGNCEN
jgi:hypothetical protein